jgi:hypothetical protein
MIIFYHPFIFYTCVRPKTKLMNKSLQFGEAADGFDFPVLNEREVRAAAGILFLATFMSLMLILFKNNFLPIKYVITGFLTDFIIRVLISPKFSPTLIIGRMIVGNQTPEYVGSKPKNLHGQSALFYRQRCLYSW